MTTILLIMVLPVAAGAAGLLFGLRVRRGWWLTAFALLAPALAMITAWAPRVDASQQLLILAAAYYGLLVVAAFAGIFLAPVMRRWWDARQRETPSP